MKYGNLSYIECVRQALQISSEDKLKNSIKKNEKAMAENFLNTKVLDNQAWPWMDVSNQ